MTPELATQRDTPEQCPCCGGTTFTLHTVLWPELIESWRLSSEEAAYIDRQQGLRCDVCHCNLRSMVLAQAILSSFNYTGTMARFVEEQVFQHLSVLEINEAGDLSQYLARLPGRILASYPEVNMLQMPFADQTFDLVVHSDTLEHVSDPVAALAECRRVLVPGGICAFTVPIVVGRLRAYPNNPAARKAIKPQAKRCTSFSDRLLHSRAMDCRQAITECQAYIWKTTVCTLSMAPMHGPIS